MHNSGLSTNRNIPLIILTQCIDKCTRNLSIYIEKCRKLTENSSTLSRKILIFSDNEIFLKMDPLKFKLDFSIWIQAISYVSFLLAQHFLFALIDEHETKKIQTTRDPSQSTLNFHLRQISVWQRQRLPKKVINVLSCVQRKKHWQKCCCHRLTNYF